MSKSLKPRSRRMQLIAPVAAMAFAIGGLGLAQATTTATGHGEMEFGKTVGYYQGNTVDFTYTHGYYCDTTVPSTAPSGCEVGAHWRVAPSTQHDPLYITVPLGFTVPMSQMDCPSGLKCVDHPAGMDLTRLADALAPIFKTTPSALLPALRDFQTPGHDHFITDLNNGQPEWWDVYVVGVTNRTVYEEIHARADYHYIQALIEEKSPYVVGPIPTNLFLYFKAL